MHQFSLFTRVRTRYLLPGALAVCAAAACPAAMALTISGTPPTSVTAGSAYTFKPHANAEGWWGIQNKPAWATFSIVNGSLTGTPTSAQVGTYTGIHVYVTNGKTASGTGAFSITVKPAGTTTTSPGTATLNWTPPTENTNGSALTNLAGYRLHYGTSASNLSTIVQVPGASVRSYTIKNLGAATWYFAITAYTNTGVQGTMSKVVSKAVN
jgi:hypothetical protein